MAGTTGGEQMDGAWDRRALLAAGLIFALWAIAPPLVTPNISLDAAEGLVWGRGWRLGYEKHPPLQAWLLEATRVVIGRGPWAHVWLSAACGALMHLAVWRGARLLVSPATAFWASAALQTVFYVNYAIPEFNPNVLLLPVFAGAGWLAIRALKFGGARDWIGLGLILGAGMYAKYAAAVVALVIAGFFVADPQARRRLASPWPYVGAGAAALAFLPHAAWMLNAGGETVGYVVDRAQIAAGLGGRLANAAEMLGAVLGTSLLLILAMALGRGGARLSAEDAPAPAPTSAERRLVYALALGPFAVALAMALIAGFRIKSAWMAPFWTWTPLALMLVFRIDVTSRAWRRGAAVIVASAALGLAAFLGANGLGPRLSGEPLRVHFPGRPLAAELERIWAERAEGPLPVVIGDTFIAGSAAHYAASAPVVRDHPDERVNPWASDALLARTGALIVWDADVDEGGGAETARYPHAQFVGVLSLDYLAAGVEAPARVGVAYLPPSPGE